MGDDLAWDTGAASFESARLVSVCSYNNAMYSKLLQVSLLISQFLLRYIIGVCLNKHYSLKV